MLTSADAFTQHRERIEVPQDGVWTILLMFAWPAAWYTLLIYVIGR